MGGILPEALPELFPDCALCCLGGIGGADDLAPMCDGVFSFERQYDHGTATHELHQAGEERALAVHCVETFSFLLTQMDLAHAQHFEAFVDNPLEDDALFLEFDNVGFDDGKSALGGHGGRIYTYCAARGQKLAQGEVTALGSRTS